MKRLSGLFAVLLLLVLPVVAQEDAARIDFPPPVYDLSGTVEVTGTANPPDLVNYFLEAAPYNPTNPDAEARWRPVSLPSTTPVTDDVLAEWDTTRLADGLYQLRLQVRRADADPLRVVVRPLRIANGVERPVAPTVAPPAATEEVTAPPVATEEVSAPLPGDPDFDPAELRALAVPRPEPANPLPVPVGGHVFQFSEQTVEAMDSAGMTWMKWQIPFDVNNVFGGLQAALDRVNFAHENGFRVLLSIKGDKDQLAELGEDYYARYAEFVGLVANYGPEAIQVWNEQNLDREWPTGRIDPFAYVQMLQAAYEAIKAVDETILVITGAPAPTGAEGAFGLERVWNDDRYYRGMANAGVVNYADCIGIHYNEGIVPPSLRGGDPREPDYPTRYLPLMIERAAFPFRDFDIPFCFSELGYLSPDGYDMPLPSGFAWAANTSVDEQAEWLADAIDIAADFPGVEIALIIVWNIDSDVYTEGDPQGGYAIIRPGGACPACATIAALAAE
jgi:hypothetical protein